MLIRQPPIYAVLATERCPLDDNDMLGEEYSTMQVVSQHGLTVGDLYGIAERLVDGHEPCRKSDGGFAFIDSEPRRVSFSVRFSECLYREDWQHVTTHSERAWNVIEKNGRIADKWRFPIPTRPSALPEETFQEREPSDDDQDSGFESEEQDEWREMSERQLADASYVYYGDDGQEAELESMDEFEEMAEHQLAEAVYEGYGDEMRLE